MKRFKCPTCKRVTEAMASEAWCPGPAGSTKKHITPILMQPFAPKAPTGKASR